ncbi:cis-prenyltransferase [Lathyrus oleraceus]|uniref:Cis-prenyltransferase n=1 Tax=Pisum sativum TaxID=3888 RepID=A0A9D4XXT6_PEA|nr:cis-prenyltransferase [Pisum sativum]
MATTALLRFTPTSGKTNSHAIPFSSPLSSSSPQLNNRSVYLTKPTHLPQRLKLSFAAGGDGGDGVGRGGSSGGGDMASRPNFGLNELDFVFSTLVVGAILNFTLMYLLAPSLGSASATLPAIFASCPKSHMFEPGAFSLLDRLGTLVYKGTIFSAVGFGAGLAGTALSNGLIKLRKKMDPTFETPNKAPPTLLNSLTWAAHMGLSSNLRYQTLNGAEFMLERGLNPLVFKASVLVLRVANNVLGGMSFVVLARLTGAQSSGVKKPSELEVGLVEKAEREREEEALESSNQTTATK